MSKPKRFSGIMVSSTFSDLVEHRQEVVDIINGLGFHPIDMKNYVANAKGDVLQTSLGMVEDATAFVSAISHRYGQTPYCATNNPDELSITEVEFNRAMELGLPILLFVMDDEHPITRKADVETDPVKIVKLENFRKRAKKMHEGSDVERVYSVFKSREEFTKQAGIALGNLAKNLETVAPSEPEQEAAKPQDPPKDTLKTAKAPDLRALPRYLGSHDFVGRKAELDTLDDWCAAADPNPMLLFEAIGGTGKSMVTWTWLNTHAAQKRGDWQGRFWFSFYEGGATMRAFCQEALAYMTDRPVKELHKLTTRAMMPDLLGELEARPWLLVLDGLERILVAYHRNDAARLRDEDVDTTTDQILNRDPRAAINPEDEELLQKLAAPSKSKVLVSTRLIPQALFNKSQMPIPGVRREPLHGLRPEDAEQLFRSCSVTGDSATIREYLQSNCDCHPLVIGALAGLVNEDMKHRGDFDTWLADPEAGGKLGLADLDLTKSKEHILDAAIDALNDTDRRLLQTLALLNTGVDYDTLITFNPHTPPKPEAPSDPENDFRTWYQKDTMGKQAAKVEYKESLAGFKLALEAWETAPETRAATGRFDETLRQLEKRGLLQYERGLKTYDLHPVVRGVASGRLSGDEARDIGEGVVDYFSSKPHTPWEQATTLKDVEPGIQLVEALTSLGKFERAINVFAGDFADSLIYNLLARKQLQQLLRPFFPNGWNGEIELRIPRSQAYIFSVLNIAFNTTDAELALHFTLRALSINLAEENPLEVSISIREVAIYYDDLGDRAVAEKLFSYCLQLRELIEDEDAIFCLLIDQYSFAISCGNLKQAEKLWSRLDAMKETPIPRVLYRVGTKETRHARARFYSGQLTDTELVIAEKLCRDENSRSSLCACLSLRGEWCISKREPELAIEPLSELIKLLRSTGNDSASSEVLLALAKIRMDQDATVRQVAEQYDDQENFKIAFFVAQIWQELGETDLAVQAALRAHKDAVGCGQPYVYRYYLDQTTKLLKDLGEPVPPVPQHEPSQDIVFEWEPTVLALIEKTRKEREERERKKRKRKKD